MSEPVAIRTLVVDTNTPGTEIFLADSEGKLIAHSTNRLEKDLPVAMYKIRYRIGSRVTDSLIELEPGEEPFSAPVPSLPLVSAAPILNEGVNTKQQASQFAQDAPHGRRVQLGSGGSLMIFVYSHLSPSSPAPPPSQPAAGISIHRFSGEFMADLADARTSAGCSACTFDLDPGSYLLRTKVDSGAPIEQTVTIARGWQTGLYMGLILTEANPVVAQSSWQFDLAQTGMNMVRDDAYSTPSANDFRWNAAARQALAAGRSIAAPDPKMMKALLRGKFDNPMFGIYAGHLLALQREHDSELPPEDRNILPENVEVLRELHRNLTDAIGPHPDVDALLIALNDPRAKDLNYAEPPMVRASWSLVLSASSPERDLRPERSYSARIAALLWGSSAWLNWRMPPPQSAAVQSSPELLQELITEAIEGDLNETLKTFYRGGGKLSPDERLLLIFLASARGRLLLADELTADSDRTGRAGQFVYPILRHLVESDVQKKTRLKVADEFKPEKLVSASGIPYQSLLEAASTLSEKLGLKSRGLFSNWLWK